MVEHIPYTTAEEADARSTEMWDAVKGPGWQPGNVTTRLYGTRQRTGDPELDAGLPDGVDVALQVPGRDAKLDKLLREDQLTQDEMLMLVGLYPAWGAAGKQYNIGDLVAYNAQIFRCVQAHTSQSDWHPDIVPALWTATVPAGVIPEWVQPTGAQDAYNIGDRVIFEGAVWESVINANVWSPTVYPAGWTRV